MVEFKGVAYRQNSEAPWKFSFVANVSQLIDNCGVPRKSETNEAGFQRHKDDSRIDDIEKFFEEERNSSPTSIVIGLHEGKSTLAFTGGNDGDNIRDATLTIHDFEAKTVEEIAEETVKVVSPKAKMVYIQLQ